ncbi:hypothetical protein GOODEAATRI_033051, partial [Goodea atripinnis]
AVMKLGLSVQKPVFIAVGLWIFSDLQAQFRPSAALPGLQGPGMSLLKSLQSLAAPDIRRPHDGDVISKNCDDDDSIQQAEGPAVNPDTLQPPAVLSDLYTALSDVWTPRCSDLPDLGLFPEK